MGKRRKQYPIEVVTAVKFIQSRDNVKFGQVIMNYDIDYLFNFGEGIIHHRAERGFKGNCGKSSKKHRTNMQAKKQLQQSYLSFGKKGEVPFSTILSIHQPKIRYKMSERLNKDNLFDHLSNL